VREGGVGEFFDRSRGGGELRRYRHEKGKREREEGRDVRTWGKEGE